MTREEIFGDRWFLKGVDLEQAGTTGTIDVVEKLPVGRDRELKATVGFREFKKRLILNETQFNAIVEISGQDDTDNWPGVRVRLRPSTVTIKNGGGEKTVDTIVIEAAAPEKPAEKFTLTRKPKSTPAPAGRQVNDQAETNPY